MTTFNKVERVLYRVADIIGYGFLVLLVLTALGGLYKFYTQKEYRYDLTFSLASFTDDTPDITLWLKQDIYTGKIYTCWHDFRGGPEDFQQNCSQLDIDNNIYPLHELYYLK